MLETENTTTSPLISFSDIKVEPIEGWESFFDEGKAFLKTGIGAHQKKKKAFTPEILYNIIAMAIEKFVMAALMRHGALPYNHTMTDLVESLDEVFPGMIAEIREQLLAMDKYQEICDVDAFNISPPETDEIPWMLALASRMQELAQTRIEGAVQ